MAKTIEELDFKLKLVDKEFTSQIERDMKLAQELNTSLSNVLDMKRKINGVSKDDVTNNRRALMMMKDKVKYSQMEAREVLKTAIQQEKLTQLRARANQHQGTSNRLLKEATSLAASYVSLWGAKKLIESIVQTTGEFELQRTTLAAMLQDAERATQIFGQLKTFSVSSPFSFRELATYAKQLTAYSVPVNDLFNTTKMLADVSAGLGVGMDRLVLAYGQVRSAEFLRGQEIRQFTESGIPILEELRKQFVALGEEGVTVADVFDKVSRRLVPFEMVDKVFKDLTSEGGKFYRMQEIQAETLRGKISNLKDAYMIMFNEIGTRQDGFLKGGVDAIRRLAENYETVGRVIVGLVATYGTFRVAMAAMTIAEEVHIATMVRGNFAIVRRQALLASLTKHSKLLAAAQKLIASTNPWVALGAAVAGIGAYFITAGVQAARFRKELKDIADVKFNEAEKSVTTFQRLADQLKNSTEGSQAYRDAIADLNRQYGDYLPNLLSEKNALTEILRVENSVAEAIRARAKAYASEEGLRKIEERYGKDIQKQGEGVIGVLGGVGIGQKAAADFLKGFRTRLENDPERGVRGSFMEAIDDYFGDGTYGKISANQYWHYSMDIIESYADAVRGLVKDNQKFLEEIEIRFGGQGYSTDLERQISEPIIAAYNKAMQALRNEKLPSEEFAERANTLELTKLEQLKKAYEELDEDAGNRGKKGAWANKIKEIQAQIDALRPKSLGWLQKLVNPFVTGAGNNDLRAREDMGYAEYLDNLRKEYKAVSESYADSDATYRKLTADKQKGLAIDVGILDKATRQNEAYKQRKEVIEKIGAALGISLESGNKKSGGKSQAQKDLETRIDLLKKLQTAYERLAPYVGDEKMGDVLSNLFSSTEVANKDGLIRSLDYRKQLIDSAIKLEKYDKDAAERLRTYIGYDETSEQVKAYEELAKAQKNAQATAERYRDFMQGWISGMEIEGDGSEFKLSKIVSDYSAALDKIANKADEARKKLNAKAEAERKVGTWSILGFSKDLTEIGSRETLDADNALAIYSEKGREAIRKMYEEWRTNAMDFSNLSDKTLGQLRDMKAKIEGFSTDNAQIFPPEVLANLKTLGIGLEEVQAIIEKLKRQDANKLNIDIKKETIDKWQALVSNISGAAEAVQVYANAAGNSNLSSAMEGIMGVADILSGVLGRLSQGDILGAVVAGVSSLFQKVMEAFTASAKLNAAISEAAREAERVNAELRLSAGVDTVFGENTLARMRNAIDLMKGYGNAAAKNREDANRNIIWRSGLFNWGRSSKSLAEMVSEMGYSLYDELGNLNANALQAILDTYENLDNVSKQWIEGAIKNTELYEEALAQLKGVMSDTWGSVANDMADKLITARKEVGDAYHALADDLRMTFGDMADDIAHSIVESFIIDEVLAKYSDDLEELYKMIGGGAGEERVASAFATLAESIIADSAIAADFTNRIYNALAQYGITFGESSNDVVNGIKGITEDTANLLASYLNAMRADVSFGKMQRDNILAEIRNIASYVASPTLVDYINKIQANTYDSARATESILYDLRSMMTTETGQVALRVLS